ncbi:MAG: restriction endonuclease subunit S [Planctomycetes bacterium]|nr:restriction endonuclease subunit S [Planctomycetota bacterium]
MVRPTHRRSEVGLIPNEWEVVALGSLCHCYSGGTPNTSVPSYYGGSIPWVTSGDLNLLRIRDVPGRITTAGLANSAAKMVEPGTLLVALYGATAGVAALTEIRAAINQAVMAVVTRRLATEYLFQFLRYRKEALIKTYTQGGQPNLTGGIVRSFLVPIPNARVEQEAIAEALGDADALIESLEQLLAKKRHIKQGAMQELLTGKKRLPGFCKPWIARRLDEIAEVVMGQSPSSRHYNTKGNGLPLIQGNADIRDRRTVRRVFTTEVTKRGRSGDTLMSVRAPVGEISRACFDVCLGRGVCAIRSSSALVYHALIAMEPTWVKLASGSTFDSVNGFTVKAVQIFMPMDEAEQAAIAEVLADMDAELAALEAKLTKARQLKQGMMQELLTGRIRLV